MAGDHVQEHQQAHVCLDRLLPERLGLRGTAWLRGVEVQAVPVRTVPVRTPVFRLIVSRELVAARVPGSVARSERPAPPGALKLLFHRLHERLVPERSRS